MTVPPLPRASLADLLRQAGAALKATQPPPELQARVRAAALAVAPARRAAGPLRTLGRGWRPVPAAALALASVLVATTFVVLRPVPPLAIVDDGLQLGVFVSVAPADHWPRDPAPAWLVSTELQGERLAAMGLPYDPARAGASVRAELLLHPSGEVLAVRIPR